MAVESSPGGGLHPRAVASSAPRIQYCPDASCTASLGGHSVSPCGQRTILKHCRLRNTRRGSPRVRRKPSDIFPRVEHIDARTREIPNGPRRDRPASGGAMAARRQSECRARRNPTPRDVKTIACVARAAGPCCACRSRRILSPRFTAQRLAEPVQPAAICPSVKAAGTASPDTYRRRMGRRGQASGTSPLPQDPAP